MNYKVSVVIPTRGDRNDTLYGCLDSLHKTAPDAEVIVVVDGDDTNVGDVVSHAKIVWCEDAPGAIDCWNYGASLATGNALVLGADDVVFQEGWLEAAMKELVSMHMVGLVALNDMSPNAGKLATHYLASRNYLVNEWGGVLAIPAYEHYFIDTEATYRAQRDKCFRYAEDAKLDHLHPIWGKGDDDDTYRKGMATFEEGKVTFEQRMEQGFPNTWEPSFTMVDTVEGWGRVAVGSRVYRAPVPEFHNSWSFLLTIGLDKGDSLLASPLNKPGHLAANILTRGFLNSQCNSILFVDDDMQFPPDSLRILRNNKDNWEYDVVMGFCTHKTNPPHPVVLKLLDEPEPPFNLKGEHYGSLRDIPDNSVIDVDAVGLAFTLIKRHVFEAMINEYGALHSPYFEWGKFEEGEDIFFSRWCRNHGFRLAVDTNVKIDHMGVEPHNWFLFHEYLKQLGN